jgi:membrane-bound lytic murein transglycosylase B
MLVLRTIGLALLGALWFGDGFANSLSFEQWVRQLRVEALQRGITASAFDDSLAGVQPIPRVLELDSNQPEFTMTFDQYIERVVSPTRVEQGRQLLKSHRDLLRQVSGQYGVAPKIIVALWGIESNYGQRQGEYSVIAALATLAYDGRRARYFRQELFNALRIVSEGHIRPTEMKGSWAGAMGQCQFMPSSYLKLAVDQDGDGRRDIWASLPDVFGSIANYMNKVGWKEDQIWGREVSLPATMSAKPLLGTKRTVNEWRRLGLRKPDGSELPSAELRAELIQGGDSAHYFLTYDNFRAIMGWNNSRLFALAVGLLADRIED